jgi:hypothetical protein
MATQLRRRASAGVCGSTGLKEMPPPASFLPWRVAVPSA